MLSKLYVASEKDRREAQKREKRKQIEKERKERIFDPRFRKIGVCFCYGYVRYTYIFTIPHNSQ